MMALRPNTLDKSMKAINQMELAERLMIKEVSQRAYSRKVSSTDLDGKYREMGRRFNKVYGTRVNYVILYN